jgi:hypothetical protein
MSIDVRHRQLSHRSSQWLIDTCNPTKSTTAQCALDSPVDAVLHAAELHGILPAVLARLRELAKEPDWAWVSDAANHEIIEAARQQNINQAGMQLRLRHYGSAILQSFKDVGHPATIVKGPTFADRLYPRPSLRTFTDIDILIPIGARAASRDIMLGHGFEPHEEDYRKGREYFEDVWLLVEDRRVSIEIHSNLIHNPNLRHRASLGYEDVAATGSGDPADPTALLMLAATHGAYSHQFDRLQHLVDISLAARGAGGQVDNQRLSEACAATGTKRAVYAGLMLTASAFADTSARAIAEMLAPSLADQLAASLVTPHAVAQARGGNRSLGSWRRKLLRQAIRIG